MSKAISFGSQMSRWRERAGLSQRELAKILDVKASYISYIEQDKRKPSLSLLLEAASTIGIDAREAFLLVHPECESFVGPSRKAVRKDAWTIFSSNRKVLGRWRVTRPELRFLKRLKTLGNVTDPRSFLFVLNSVRQALEEE